MKYVKRNNDNSHSQASTNFVRHVIHLVTCCPRRNRQNLEKLRKLSVVTTQSRFQSTHAAFVSFQKFRYNGDQLLPRIYRNSYGFLPGLLSHKLRPQPATNSLTMVEMLFLSLSVFNVFLYIHIQKLFYLTIELDKVNDLLLR